MSLNTTELKELGIDKLFNTKDAATIMGRSAKTLRNWSMTGNGPIQPIRTQGKGPLWWRLSDIQKFISGKMQ